MANRLATPEKFAFLDHLSASDSTRYQNAYWLVTNFDDPVWTCKFGKQKIVIDFNVELDDGSLLIDAKNDTLLRSFKTWLCIQSTGKHDVSFPVTDYYKVLAILPLIDYFLINSKHLQIAQFGLEALTANDLKQLLWDYASKGHVAFVIYQWDIRLAEYLRDSTNQVTQEELNAAIAEYPAILEIEPDIDRILDLSDEQLIRARAYLLLNGFYRRRSTPEDSYLFSPNTAALSKQIYPHTLWGVRKNYPVPTELCFGPQAQYQRELNAVPVKNQNRYALSVAELNKIIESIRSMGLLKVVNLPVPSSALSATTDQAFLDSLPTSARGRYKTLPYEVTSKALRSSIEFSLKFGNDLVISYLNIVRAARIAGVKSLKYFSDTHDITQFLEPAIKNLGVRYWSLSHQLLQPPRGISHRPPKPRPPSSEFFLRMRKNEGLSELITILYGAVQICVGTVIARRQGELDDLPADNALDISRRYMIFRNRKTGVHGRRQEIARPLPDISAQFVGILQSLQDGLVELGVISATTKLFAPPHSDFLELCAGASSAKYLNRFCDYFELGTDSEGRRYYIRQHQLRRNFAMMFFWGSAFGGIETLQWFLGHADPEHLYNYITESIPGTALTSVKAAYAADLLTHNRQETDELAKLVERHFGTRNFSVLDSSELENYIEDLLDDSNVSIEPQFYTSNDGKRYKILISVKGN